MAEAQLFPTPAFWGCPSRRDSRQAPWGAMEGNRGAVPVRRRSNSFDAKRLSSMQDGDDVESDDRDSFRQLAKPALINHADLGSWLLSLPQKSG